MVHEQGVLVVKVVHGDKAAQLVKQANQFNEPAPAGTEYMVIRLQARDRHARAPRSRAYRQRLAQDRRRGECDLRPVIACRWGVLSGSKGEHKLTLIFEPLFSLTGMV